MQCISIELNKAATGFSPNFTQPCSVQFSHCFSYMEFLATIQHSAYLTHSNKSEKTLFYIFSSALNRMFMVSLQVVFSWYLQYSFFPIASYTALLCITICHVVRNDLLSPSSVTYIFLAFSVASGVVNFKRVPFLMYLQTISSTEHVLYCLS